MFGKYGLHFENKMFALVCDNKLFLKQTLSGREFIIDLVEESPYPSAKPCFLIEGKLEDSVWLKNNQDNCKRIARTQT
jgi:TfoX/Sxy family transcriptional regulator of competence genes